MSKDFKEKYERVCSVKDKALSLVETQMNGNIQNVDAKELGEVADIAKDMAEIMKLCSEAEYYFKITEAMDKHSNDENMEYIEEYIPKSKRYYSRPHMCDDDRYDENYRSRMYYTDPSVNMNMRGTTRSNISHGNMDGRAYISRRGYMESKNNGADNATLISEIRKWASDTAEDVMEMIKDASPEEKAVLKQHFNQIASKIV